MQRILAVATNDATALHGKKTGLWLAELTHFLDVIIPAGYGYEIASPKGGKVPLDEKSTVVRDATNARFMNDPDFVQKLEHSRACADVGAADYAALYLGGGHGTMFDFRQSGALQNLITAFHALGRPVSGVCHGVCALIDAKDERGLPLVRGRTLTGFSNAEDTLAGMKKLLPFLLEDALREQGAHYKKNLVPFTERIEVDGLLITGQNPRSARGVALKLLEQLGRRARDVVRRTAAS